MTKREAVRRDDQRQASVAANQAEPGRPHPLLLGKELLSRADLVALGVPWSRAHLYKVMAAGRFPRPVSTGPGLYDRKLWRRRDVEAWLRKLRPAVKSGGEAASNTAQPRVEARGRRGICRGWMTNQRSALTRRLMETTEGRSRVRG